MFQMRFSMRMPEDDRSPAERSAALTASYEAAIEMAAWGEQNGLAAAVLSEHHSSPDGYLPSPLLLASAMAARTESTFIVVAALLGLLYDPVRLAEDLAVLDHISSGRVLCVVGLGYRDEEYELYGVDPTARAPQMEELLATLRQAWTAQPFDHGTRGNVVVTPAPATAGGPPLAYGGHTVAAARRAARHGLLLMAEAPREDLRTAYEEEAQRLGITAPGCQIPAADTSSTEFVADDLDAAWAELGPRMLQEIRLYRGWNTKAGKSGITSLSDAETVEELRKEQGSYRIYTLAEATDLVAAGHVLALEPLCGGLAPERAWHYLRLAAAAGSAS
jgi:alkanesulfonate monooxygenase SsuD/methylene tetrahydromethanopterin reductase-like flavin-dependent oxidoreductase (luciferase family)